MNAILNRLAEPSSWAGISTVITTAGHMVTTGQTSSALFGALLAGLAAIFAPERGKR